MFIRQEGLENVKKFSVMCTEDRIQREKISNALEISSLGERLE